MLIVDDFVMLGKTVPEPNSDGRVMVCSAGVIPQLRTLVRIYPLGRRDAPRRWDICRVPLEINPKDHRRESWKLAGDRSPETHDRINQVFEVTGAIARKDRAALLQPYVIDSIKQANEDRRSLGIIHPTGVELYFEHSPESPESPQLSLFAGDVFERRLVGARRFPFIPRLRFSDGVSDHDLMLRDWGCYEFMRKHLDDYDYYRQHMAGALHLTAESSLLVGNLNHHRTAWLVISVLNGLRDAPTLFEVGAA